MTIPNITSPSFPRSDAPRPMFSALAIASSGLSAQRMRMDVIAQNLANVETTRTPQGGPYQRRYVGLEAIEPMATTNVSSSASTTTALPGATSTASAVSSSTPAAVGVAAAAAATSQALSSATGVATDDSADVTGGVRVTGIFSDPSQGPMVYNPGSPDADKNGYVKMPNVSMTDELMDLMNSRRIYEANATVFQVARAMLHKAIDI
jgi:flagellar basal-body rod protein FlgC